MRSLAIAALLLAACSEEPIPSDFNLRYDDAAVVYSPIGSGAFVCTMNMPHSVRGGPDFMLAGVVPCDVDGSTIVCVGGDPSRMHVTTWTIDMSGDRSSATVITANEDSSPENLSDCTGTVEATVAPIE